jgi:hypothetical protein
MSPARGLNHGATPLPAGGGVTMWPSGSHKALAPIKGTPSGVPRSFPTTAGRRLNMTESTRSLSSLQQDSRNANKGNARGLEMIRASLEKLGAGRSIVLDRNGRIIAGNQTVRAAGLAGMDDVIVVRTDGSRIVAVQRTDLDLDSPEGREMALADNRSSEVGGRARLVGGRPGGTAGRRPGPVRPVQRRGDRCASGGSERGPVRCAGPWPGGKRGGAVPGPGPRHRRRRGPRPQAARTAGAAGGPGPDSPGVLPAAPVQRV